MAVNEVPGLKKLFRVADRAHKSSPKSAATVLDSNKNLAPTKIHGRGL